MEQPSIAEAFPNHENLFESEPAIAFTFMLIVLGLDSVALLGNGLIVGAFIYNAKIRIPRHYYVLNLAAADLTIAAFSVPFYASTIVLGGWKLGKGFCAFWITVDLVLRLEGIFSILLISYDRYQLVRNPIQYNARPCGKWTALKRIGVSWVLALLFRIPFIITSFTWHESGEDAPKSYTMCSPSSAIDPPFRIGVLLYDALYTACSITIEYVIPLVCIIYWNSSLLHKIRQTRRISNSITKLIVVKQKRKLSDDRVSCFQSDDIYTVKDGHQKTQNLDAISLFSCTSEGRKMSLETQKEEIKQSRDKIAQTIIPAPSPNFSFNKKSVQRATIILVFVTLEIIILRTPYAAARIVSLICGVCMSWTTYTSLYWLGWGVSIINPFLYGFISGAIKEYGLRILRCCNQPCIKG